MHHIFRKTPDAKNNCQPAINNQQSTMGSGSSVVSSSQKNKDVDFFSLLTERKENKKVMPCLVPSNSGKKVLIYVGPESVISFMQSGNGPVGTEFSTKSLQEFGALQEFLTTGFPIPMSAPIPPDHSFMMGNTKVSWVGMCAYFDCPLKNAVFPYPYDSDKKLREAIHGEEVKKSKIGQQIALLKAQSSPQKNHTSRKIRQERKEREEDWIFGVDGDLEDYHKMLAGARKSGTTSQMEKPSLGGSIEYLSLQQQIASCDANIALLKKKLEGNCPIHNFFVRVFC